MACEDQIGSDDLINTKDDATFLGEISTSREGAVSTGSPITEATNRFGETTDTIQGRLNKLGVIYSDPVKEWSANETITQLEAVRYNGDIYIPTAPLPFNNGASFDVSQYTLYNGTNDEQVRQILSQDGYTRMLTLQQAIENTLAQEGDYIRITDRGLGLFQYKTGLTADGIAILETTTEGLSLEIQASMINKVSWFGAKEGIDSSDNINTATQYTPAYGILQIDGDFIGTNIVINKEDITILGGKITAPLDATESCYVVTSDNVEFQKANTFVDWENLTAPGIINVGGIHAENVKGLRIIGGYILGARSDSYNPDNGTIDEVRSALNLYRCQDAYISPTKVGDCGFIDAVGLWESFNCNLDGGLYDNSRYSGIATATNLDNAPAGSYGHHTVSNVTVSNCLTSSITINDFYGKVINPDVDGGLNGVNFGHVASSPGQSGIFADNGQLIGGVIRNTSAHGVAIGESRNIKVLGTVIEDTGGSGVRFFDDCDGGYIGGGVTIKRCGETAVGFSIGAFAGSYAVDGIVCEDAQSHGIFCIGGTKYTISNVNIKDVDNDNLNRNVINWDSSPMAPVELNVTNLIYEHESSASKANIGINITDAALDTSVTITGCDLKDVEFEKFKFSGVVPDGLFIYKNRLSYDPMVGFHSLLSADSSTNVSNGNISIYSIPKITYRDADCTSRKIHVSSITDGSFEISGGSGGDAEFHYEV